METPDSSAKPVAEVQFPGLRILRGGDRAHFFPERERICVADAFSDDLRRGFSDAAARRDRAGRLYRSSWAPRRASLDSRFDGDRDRFNRLYAFLRIDWADCAGAG